jgi:hypothetical protein
MYRDRGVASILASQDGPSCGLMPVIADHPEASSPRHQRVRSRDITISLYLREESVTRPLAAYLMVRHSRQLPCVLHQDQHAQLDLPLRCVELDAVVTTHALDHIDLTSRCSLSSIRHVMSV